MSVAGGGVFNSRFCHNRFRGTVFAAGVAFISCVAPIEGILVKLRTVHQGLENWRGLRLATTHMPG